MSRGHDGPRTLDVQSVLYGNDAQDIVRAAEALAHSVLLAVSDGSVSEWTLHLGDCSPEPVIDVAARAAIESSVVAAGGVLDLVEFGDNLGSAEGHNRLAARGEADTMLILNPDAQVAPDTIGELFDSMVPGVAVAEARQVPFEHPKDYSRGTGETSWASTACALTPRSVFTAIGGFDSATFFLYCDDVDYSWRARIAGHRVLYVPSATVYHDKRLTPTADWPASAAEIYYSAEAALLLAHKYSRPDIVRGLVERYAKDSEPAVRRALGEYRSREAAGTLPTPIDPAHKVAQFTKGNYAVHRF